MLGLLSKQLFSQNSAFFSNLSPCPITSSNIHFRSVAAEDGKAVSIKKEDLTHFIEFELRIRELEKSQCEERLGTSEVQLNSLQAALKNAESNLTVLRQNT